MPNNQRRDSEDPLPSGAGDEAMQWDRQFTERIDAITEGEWFRELTAAVKNTSPLKHAHVHELIAALNDIEDVVRAQAADPSLRKYGPSLRDLAYWVSFYGNLSRLPLVGAYFRSFLREEVRDALSMVASLVYDSVPVVTRTALDVVDEPPGKGSATIIPFPSPKR